MPGFKILGFESLARSRGGIESTTVGRVPYAATGPVDRSAKERSTRELPMRIHSEMLPDPGSAERHAERVLWQSASELWPCYPSNESIVY